MSAMEAMHDTIVRVLKKYDLRTEIPDAERKKIFAAKKHALTAILKNEGAWDFMGSTAMTVFFKFMERGFSISLGACARVIQVSAAMAALVVISTAALTLNRYVISPSMMAGRGTHGTVVFTLGDVKLQRAGAAPADLSIRDSVRDGDVLITGGKSNLVVQIEGVGTVRILEDSRISMTSLLKGGTETVTGLESGKIFSKILKIQGQSYEVKTPTCVVAVRGTEFLTSYEEKDTEVRLLSGKVSIEPIGAKDGGTALDAGNIALADADGKVSVRSMTDLQRLELEKYALAPYIENLKEKTSEEIKAIFDGIKGREDEIDEKIRIELEKLRAEWLRLSPLDRLRRQGKPISMLHLRSGEKIGGSVVGRRGDKIVVDTGDGVIRIPANAIIKRDEIK